MTIIPPSTEGLDQVVWLQHRKLRGSTDKSEPYHGALPSFTPHEAEARRQAFEKGDSHYEYEAVPYVPLNPRGYADLDGGFI